MDFETSEELKMVQELVRGFVAEQLKPLERSLLGRAADLSDAVMYLPWEKEQELIGMVKEMGLWGVNVPEELGGIGLDTLGNCLVEEELAQTIVPFSFGDVTPLLFECNEKQKETYFSPVFNQEKYPYLALMEPGKASLAAMEMKAEKADGYYILNGRKASFSRIGEDYFAIVFATNCLSPDKGRGKAGLLTASGEAREGVTCFLVNKDAPGFTVNEAEQMTGWETRVRRPIYLNFEHCQVPAENILGEEEKAFSLAKKWLPSRRIVKSARCVGVGQRILDECTIQAQTWTSFGEVISGKPSIQSALGDIGTNIHAARLMVYEAAWKADQGKPIKRESAMVKLFATQMIHFAVDNAAHIFGAPPYVAGLPMENFCRDALAMSATDFALQLQRNIVAKDILKGLKI